MRKGEATRERIIGEALTQAVNSGLESMSIGPLADSLGLSKSGLYAHFGSKEALQLAILEEAIERFRLLVIAPGLQHPPGLERLRALYLSYLDWIKGGHAAGGCPFVTFVQEFDDKPGPLRNLLASSQSKWRLLLSRCVTEAVRDGELPDDIDANQVVFEAVGAALSYQVSVRLLNDNAAHRRAIKAFERIVSRHSFKA